jgi:hypothetical protein
MVIAPIHLTSLGGLDSGHDCMLLGNISMQPNLRVGHNHRVTCVTLWCLQPPLPACMCCCNLPCSCRRHQAAQPALTPAAVGLPGPPVPAAHCCGPAAVSSSTSKWIQCCLLNGTAGLGEAAASQPAAGGQPEGRALTGVSMSMLSVWV